MHQSKSHTKIQPFLITFAIFHAFNDLFWAKWPWNWKALQPELRKGLNLAWYHHLTHITCVQKLEDYDKNWMYFVYKLHHLFQNTRVPDENSSVTNTFHFSKLISTQDFFLHSICTIQNHILKFERFLTSFAIFHIFNDLFWAKWPCNWKALQRNSEKVETFHGIIIWPT